MSQLIRFVSHSFKHSSSVMQKSLVMATTSPGMAHTISFC